jgi:Asp-tRNA(Asn)/Glu-tRNA(Gln) amidotransferase A subunit family amidase
MTGTLTAALLPTPELPALPPELALPLRHRPDTLPPTASGWAAAADSRFRACVELRSGIRPGIRVGVKDTVDVAGFSTRLGLRWHRHYPRASATALAGVPPEWINAKLVTTELSIGLEHGCVNPYFPHLDPGGSSTGSAIAVAANICDLAMGTDTVASVRLPAAACGVVGLRLTHDPDALTGMFGLSAYLDAPGWLTRTVDDLAVAWERLDLAGRRDGRRVGAVVGARWRVGVADEAIVDEMEPELRRSFQDLVAALVAAGHEVVEVRLGALFHDRGLAYELCAREAADRYGALGAQLSASTRRALDRGAATGDGRLRELVETHRQHRVAARSTLGASGLDAWLLPAGTMMPRNIHTEPAPDSTIPRPAVGSSPHVNYAAAAAFLGLPALTFPVGHSASHDAPISVQLIGPEWTEARLIGLAGAVTAVSGHRSFRIPWVGS